MKARVALVATLGAMLISLGARSTLSHAAAGTREVAFEVGPPRPDWLGSRRSRNDHRATARFAATLARPMETMVSCDPTCAAVGLRASDGQLGTAADTDDGAKLAFARLPLAGELASSNDLHLASMRVREGVHEYSYLRGDGPVACDCAVTVSIRADGAVVSVSGRKLAGYHTLPRAPRYTRGEALVSATRQLSAEAPVLTDPTGLENPELSAWIVVPVGDRAALAHRFALRLDRLPYVVDVDDATLTVVRVTPDRRFDRVDTIVLDVPVRETVLPVGWSSQE